MGKINLEQARPGMILKEPLRKASGIVLFGEGTQLNESILRRMKQWRIKQIIVQGEESGEDQAVEKTILNPDAFEKARKQIFEELDHRFEGYEKDLIMMVIKEAALEHLISHVAVDRQ
ncbi:hypothetical protein ACFL5K_05885 [Gemmatimonadota bacterium]